MKKKPGRKLDVYTYDGKTLTTRQWAHRLRIKKETFLRRMMRLRRGLITELEAFSTVSENAKRQRQTRGQADSVFSYLEINRTEEGFKPKPCSTNTTHAPGSPEKVEVLAARVEAGEELWHTDDSLSTDGTLTLGGWDRGEFYLASVVRDEKPNPEYRVSE